MKEMRYNRYIVQLSLSFLLSAALVLLNVQPAAAGISREGFYRENEILYYNESDICAAPSASGVAAGAPLVGSDNQEKAFNFFMQKGLANFKAAGIVGNLIVESGGPQLDPAVKQFSGGPGRGIVQWEVGGRWDTSNPNMLDFAAKNNLDPLTLEAQLAFLWEELQTSEKRAFTALDATTNVDEAASQFMLKFERPRDQSRAKQLGRVKLAEGVLARYGNGTNPSTNTLVQSPQSQPSCTSAAANAGAFTGQPGQTKKQGSGWSLNDNTDYSTAPCVSGSTETRTYRHPTRGFQIRLCKVKNMEVASIMSDKLAAMVSAAGAAGVNLDGGGFRSYEDQKKTRINNGCPNDSTPSSGCSPPTAQPGSSEHERGLAVDFSAGGTIRKGSPQFNWLQANAANYGFINLPSESWHWSASGY